MRWRAAFTVGVLVASLAPLTVACGRDGTDGADGAPRSGPSAGAGVTSSPTGGASSPQPGGGGPAAQSARAVFFSSTATTVPGAHEVLHDRAEVDGFAGRFAARDTDAAAGIRAAGRATDFSRSVLVGWTRTTGCSRATSAALAVVGERLVLRVVQPKAQPECFAPYRVTVVFEAPRTLLPARPVFG